MTQEEKSLLLKDLSARLPYGVKVLNMAEGANEVCELDSIMTSRKHKDNIFVSITLPDDFVMTGIEMVKPYLRPMSSMAEEEKTEYRNIAPGIAWNHGIQFPTTNKIDWLNAHHFDYRGLIERGLALEALDGMYND